jgi:dihydrodipicolinate synthase/N-acetylneuraminate lyase
MAKKLEKAQMGKIVKSAVKVVSKAAKPIADISKNEIKNAVTLSERARLKEKLEALSKKKMGGPTKKK